MGITKTRAMLGFTALSSDNRSEFPLKKGGQGVVPLEITMLYMQYDLLTRFIQPPVAPHLTVVVEFMAELGIFSLLTLS